jgi:hypothetical protein
LSVHIVVFAVFAFFTVLRVALGRRKGFGSEATQDGEELLVFREDERGRIADFAEGFEGIDDGLIADGRGSWRRRSHGNAAGTGSDVASAVGATRLTRAEVLSPGANVSRMPRRLARGLRCVPPEVTIPGPRVHAEQAERRMQ